MNLKIITTIITLNNTEKETVEMGAENLSELFKFENEVKEFLKDKKDVKIEWLQSSGSVSEMLIQAKGIPYTHLTAIISW